jgi:hypothetical protein
MRANFISTEKSLGIGGIVKLPHRKTVAFLGCRLSECCKEQVFSSPFRFDFICTCCGKPTKAGGWNLVGIVREVVGVEYVPERYYGFSINNQKVFGITIKARQKPILEKRYHYQFETYD